MKFRALYVPHQPPKGGLESSAGQYVTEIEAPDAKTAQDFCLRLGLRYVMPLIPPFGDQHKWNGHK